MTSFAVAMIAVGKFSSMLKKKFAFDFWGYV
jgi:hypothetical protein